MSVRRPGYPAVREGPGCWRQLPFVYEAMLPPSLDDNLAAAAVVVLGTEIDWIQSHALDLYRGM